MLSAYVESALGHTSGRREEAQHADVALVDGSGESLVMRLPEADADTPTVLRVVAVFDELVERCASFADLARSVALLTDCAAGMSGPGGRVLAHCDRGGAELAGGEPEASASREAHVDGALAARVWIERDLPTRALDDLVLVRAARATHLVIERMNSDAVAVPRISNSVALLVNPDVSASRRADACRQLGYQPHQSIRIAVLRAPGAMAGELDRLRARILSSGGGSPRAAVFGHEAILVMCGTVDVDALVSPGLETRVGIGPAHPAIEAPRSCRWAREALRFAQGPGAPPVAHFDRLGSVVALAAVADANLMDFPDWVALAELSRTSTGLTAILTAEVLMHTGSQRDAAARMNLHHSTVAHRVGHVEQALGYGLGEHSNWFRAQLAIHLWRLRAGPQDP